MVYHFLRKWSGQSFLRVYTFLPGCTLISVGGMSQGGEWSSLSNQGQAFLRVYTFSPGCPLISVGRMAQGGEWSRFKRQDSYSSLLEKNSLDISLFYSEGKYSFRSHRCEWKIGPDDSVYIITLFLCRLVSDDCYEDCMTVDAYYCGGCVPLFVTICCWSSTCVLLGVVVYHWIVVMYYYG